MNRKGVVENLMGSRIAVVKLEGLVGIGSLVLNRARKPVGNVADIIGPVKEPYAVVVLKKDGRDVKKGDTLFFKPRKG
ncbi:MAG: H/ACA ribonucleoprotein complex subunit GAR1 [Thermoproteota archaeon]